MIRSLKRGGTLQSRDMEQGMNDTLKAAGRIGAELGAAKAENERLREALRWYEEKVAECRKIGSLGDNARQALDRDGGFRARDALSQQAEPVRCEYCDGTGDVHRADGEWLGECKECDAAAPAPAQDETEPVYQFQWREIGEGDWMACSHSWFRFCEASPERDTRVVEVTRPEHAEQQPVQYTIGDLTYARVFKAAGLTNLSDIQAVLDAVEAAIAQLAPQPEQSELPDPRQWTDQQVLDFLGVALRNVDVVGTVQLNEIRQGFELVMGRAALSAQGKSNADS